MLSWYVSFVMTMQIYVFLLNNFFFYYFFYGLVILLSYSCSEMVAKSFEVGDFATCPLVLPYFSHISPILDGRNMGEINNG